MALLAVVFMTQAAFICQPEFEDPCEDDRLGCDDGDEFVYLEGCELTDALAVEAGHGDDRFRSFAEGNPTTYSGGQGGQHFFTALRVANAALDRYDTLRATFTLEQQTDCSSFNAVPEPDAPGVCYRPDAMRELVLGGEPALRVDESGTVEEFGLLLQIGRLDPDLPARLTVEVEDPCRRTGRAIAAWTP